VDWTSRFARVEAAGIEPAAKLNHTRERTHISNLTHSRTHAKCVPSRLTIFNTIASPPIMHIKVTDLFKNAEISSRTALT
jgi:hypothetical protein